VVVPCRQVDGRGREIKLGNMHQCGETHARVSTSFVRTSQMTGQREALALCIFGGTTLLTQTATALAAVGDCSRAAVSDAIGNALLDRYLAAINAHDTSSARSWSCLPNSFSTQDESYRRRRFGAHLEHCGAIGMLRQDGPQAHQVDRLPRRERRCGVEQRDELLD
jgi:hypothetical protein